MKSFKSVTLLATLAILPMTVACEEGTGVNAGVGASVSFAAVGQTTLLGGTTAAQDSFSVAGHVIEISSVEMRVAELEVEGDSIEIELKSGLTVVALPANGTVVTPISAPVLPGTYDELELEVRTVRITGKFDGQPFDVSVTVDEKLEKDIRPPLVVTESSQANLTIAVQIMNWFRNSDGSAIDLRNLTATTQARLASNIEASFDAFDDHDRSGRSHDDDD